MRYFNRHGGWSHHVTATYRSGLEDKVAQQLRNANVAAEYETFKIPYSIPATQHIYTPDFVLPNGIIVETKGVFESEDRKKHLYIKDQYPHLDIRFVFSNANTKLYKGSKTTYADWCNKYGFAYATKWIPEAWFHEEKKKTEGLIYKGKRGE